MMRNVFVWSPGNVDHLDKHGVVPAEARYVVEHPWRGYPRYLGDGKYAAWGATLQGRLLQGIYLHLDDEEVDVELLDTLDRLLLQEGAEAFYVIHARDLTAREKRRR